MAKPKNNPDDENITYLGQDVDPALQEKVKEYMEYPSEEDIKSTEVTNPDVPVPVTDAEPAGSAPLLPTSELPDLSKTTKIPVTEHIAEEDPEQADKVDPEKPEESIEAEAEESDNPEKAITPINVDEVSDNSAADQLEVVSSDNPDVPLPADIEEPAPIKDELGLEDAQTSHAVDEIIASEADKLLEVEDEKTAPSTVASIKKEKKPKSNRSLKAFFKAWFTVPKYRNATLILLLMTVITAAVIPTTRYAALNTAGVRAALTMKVIDDKTGQPLKNVEVQVDNRSAKTDKDGNVKVEKIKLGSRDVKVHKPAFAEYQRKIIIGWGSNQQGEVGLTAVGAQYTFVLADFLSGKPIKGAEAVSGEASARSDDKGEIVLTVPDTDKDQLEVQILADTYRTEDLKLPTDKKDKQALQLVPSRKHTFISKRTGKFDVYKIDVDGKNEELVLAGSGLEKEDTLALVPHAKKDVVALVSTRDNVRNKDGFLLSTLTLIDINSKETKRLAQSERVQIIDWIGDKLIYVKIAQGESEASLQRHRLMSYDIETETEKELASTNYFNDILVARGAIYYSPALYKVNGSVGLFKVNADGTNKKTIYEKEAWNLFRTSYDKVSVSIGQDWFELALGNDGFTKSNGAPPVLKSRIYVDSNNSKQSLWVDDRDGKGVLIDYDTDTRDEKPLQTQSGLKNPVRWLDDDHAVFRVANGQETADYVLSTSGGVPKKIRDVTNAAGIDRWYYY
jgi:hypothetical protein